MKFSATGHGFDPASDLEPQSLPSPLPGSPPASLPQQLQARLESGLPRPVASTACSSVYPSGAAAWLARPVALPLRPGPVRPGSGRTYHGPDCECQHLCGPRDTQSTLHPALDKVRAAAANSGSPLELPSQGRRVTAASWYRRPRAHPPGRAGGGLAAGGGGLWAQSRASYEPRTLAASAGRGHRAGRGRGAGSGPGTPRGAGTRGEGPRRAGRRPSRSLPLPNAVHAFGGSGVHPAQTVWCP